MGIVVLFVGLILVQLCQSVLVNINVTQLIDHFNSSDNREFTQRVQVYTEFYKPGGPILLLVGPERAISYQYEIYTSSVFSIFAPSFHGFIVATEHRYYGESLPFGSPDSFSLDSLQYLTIEQSLADNAAVVQWLKYNSTYASLLSSSSHVLAFGGSYGGFLSALMRITYPDLILGSLASCTVPYLWGLPSQENLWFDLVSDSFLEQWPNSTCYDGIQQEFTLLLESMNSGEYTQIQKSLALCTPPSKSLTSTLFSFIKTAFSDIVLFNYPSVAVFCVPSPFTHLCSSYDYHKGDWQGINLALDLYYNASGDAGNCFDWSGPHAILPGACSETKNTKKHNSNPIKKASQSTYYNPWLYQSCTQFIYGAAGGEGIFQYGFPWTLSLSNISCHTEIPNLPYAPHSPLLPPPNSSSDPTFTNVIFSRAGFDPNRGWSPTVNVSESVVAVNMECAAHCADMDSYFSPNIAPTCVQEAFIQEIAYFGQWMSNKNQMVGAPTVGIN